MSEESAAVPDPDDDQKVESVCFLPDIPTDLKKRPITSDGIWTELKPSPWCVSIFCLWSVRTIPAGSEAEEALERSAGGQKDAAV